MNEFHFSGKDRLFLGEALFETLAVRQSRPCFAGLHWQRLCAGIDWLGIPLTLKEEGFHQAIMNFIQTHDLKDCGLKIILSFGEAQRGLSSRGNSPRLFFQSFELPRFKPSITLVKNAWVRDENNPVYRIKSISYLENVFARRQAEAQGVDDALFFNLKQSVTETCTAKVFIIKNNEIFTPPVSDGLLAGVTRQRVLNLCYEQGFSVHEASVTLPELIDADAVFVTSSLQGLQAVSRYEQQDYPAHHPLYLKLKSFLSQHDVD